MTSYLLYNTSHGAMQYHLALYLLYAKLRCKPNSRTKVPIDEDDDSQKWWVCVCVSVCVYVPLMQLHRSTGGNQFTLTLFLHAHSRSRTHTCTQCDLCSDNSAYMCLYVCMSTPRRGMMCLFLFFFCCCFYFPFHEPILTRVLLFQLLTK